MSKLILDSRTERTLGRFLPAIYVEKIILYGDPTSSDTNNRFVVRTNLLVPNDGEAVISTPTGITTLREAYKEELDNLNYYIMYFYVNSALATQLENDDPDGIYNQRLPIKYYDQIINEQLNPFDFYYNTKDSLISVRVEGQPYYSPYMISLHSFDPFSSPTPTVIFDEEGNEFIKYSQQNSSITVPYYSNWEETGELKFIVFASSESYEDAQTNIEDENLLNILIGDISYETIYQNSQVGDPERAVFVDSEEKVYQQTPLLDIGSVAHKISSITHEQVVEKFQNLLDTYSSQYNAETGFDSLKKMMDNISVILQTMPDSPGILVALQQLVPTFPDKTPSRPIGKFYKSFRNRIFTCNNSIKTGEILRRKIVYDTKIVDLRISEDLNLVDTDYVEGPLEDGAYQYNSELTDYGEIAVVDLADAVSTGAEDAATVSETQEEFIYTSNLLEHFVSEDLESYTEPDESLSINFGYFFFDYEKALAKTSNISRLFNVAKLEAFGMPIPFRSFRTVLALVERERIVTLGTSGGDAEVARITCNFADEGYPKSVSNFTYQMPQTANAYQNRAYLFTSPFDVVENGPDALVLTDGLIFENVVGEQPYAPSTATATTYGRIDDLNAGTVSSLVVRPFSDPSNIANGYGIGQSPIDNYRLMMFQLLDYVRNKANYEYPYYTVKIYVLDKTNKFLAQLIEQFSHALTRIEQYFTYAQEICSFNNNTEQFNEFFVDQMHDTYGDETKYPWITVPIIYQIHLDLLYNSYNGDFEVIKRRAAELSLQISPSNGTLENLENLVNTMRDIYDSVYASYTNINPDEERLNVYYQNLGFVYGAVETVEEEEEESTSAPRPGGEDVGTDLEDAGPQEGEEFEVGLELDEDAGLGGTGRIGGSGAVDDDVDTGRDIEGGAAAEGIQQVGY